MRKGTIKFFNADKGFGFIIDDETKKDVFVHISKCSGEVNKGDRVSFEIEQANKGLQAIKVRLS